MVFTASTAQTDDFHEIVHIGGGGFVFDMAWSEDDQILAVSSDTGVWLYSADLHGLGALPTNTSTKTDN